MHIYTCSQTHTQSKNLKRGGGEEKEEEGRGRRGRGGTEFGGAGRAMRRTMDAKMAERSLYHI